MSVFTLAISCLTTSNLPWFMDLTFQVPMQYCSLQHRTLLPSPVTSTTGCVVFAFALFLHSFSFPGSSDGKVSACNGGDQGSFPGSGIPWRKKWQPTPVFLPGKFHGWRSLAGYSPWDRKESDTTEWLHFILSGVISPLIFSSILGTYRPREFIFHCPFHTVHWVLKARILKWFAIPFSSGPRFVRTLHQDLSILGGTIQHDS